MSRVEPELLHLLKKPKIDEDNNLCPNLDDISPPSDKSCIIDGSSPTSSDEDSSDDEIMEDVDPYIVDVVEPEIGYWSANIFRCNPEDPHDIKLRDECTAFAINEHNRVMKNKSFLQLTEIENATRTRNFSCVYYITFDAFDKLSRQSLSYQTEVFCTLEGDEKDIITFKKKGDKEEMYLPVDLSDPKESSIIHRSALAVIDACNEFELPNSPFQFVKTLKALQDLSSCRKILISLEAKNSSGQVNTYFADTNYVTTDDHIAACGMKLKHKVKDDEVWAPLLKDEDA